MQLSKIPDIGKLSPARLRRLVAHGETESVEFKGRRTSLDDIAAAVVCLANGEGGIILFGVADDGTVEGHKLRDATAISRHVYHNTSPSQRVDVQSVDIEGLEVAGVWVKHSPVLVSTGSGAYHQRVGTECVPMTPDRLIVRQIDTRALDLTSALTPIPVTHVDEIQVQRYRQLLPSDETGQALAAMPTGELIRAIGAAPSYDPEMLTVAGLLMFGPVDAIRDVLPAHEALYLRTPQGSTEYDRRLVLNGPILETVDLLVREVLAASRVRRLRIGLQDLELPDYPERVLREAIVNALAHRHYTRPGDTVVRQTATYLEIESPGGFPEGISADTVIQHAPVHRNRLLCDLLDRVRYMERSGLGVDRIFEDQIRFGKLPPSYDADRTKVRLRLDASEFDESFARFVLGEEQGGRNWRVEELLIASHLRRMGPSDRPALAVLIQRPEDETQEIVGTMIPSVIEYYGAGSALRYQLSSRVQAALGAAATFTRERGLTIAYQRQLVLQHARNFGRVDNRTVRQLLQIPSNQATNLLRSMAARGDLVQRGAKRGTYYQPAPEQPELGLG